MSTRPRTWRHALGAITATVATTAALLAGGLGTGTASAAPWVGPNGPAWQPPAGVAFNNPLGGDQARHVLNNRIADGINNAPPGSEIRIATWNFNSKRFSDALIRAHRRGVGVRLLMQGNMARTYGSHMPYWVLKRNLAQPTGLGNTSFAGKCESSCRGWGGILHSKFYLFSQSGAASNVVMNGSNNLTDASAVVQWNDMYTIRNNPTAYGSFRGIFDAMARDKANPPIFREQQVAPNIRAYHYPYQGPNANYGDPILRRLRGVQCTGALNTGSGRTVIRIAQTAWMDARGEAIARRVKQLWNQGCDVRAIIAVSKPRVMNVLRAKGGRGAVPVRTITQDTTGDRVYDRYLHMKSLTIKGNYEGNRAAGVTYNGSANWTQVVLNSDEEELRINDLGLANAYIGHVNYWFTHPPRNARSRVGANTKVDPFANVEIH